jgi:hypothetical protein
MKVVFLWLGRGTSRPFRLLSSPTTEIPNCHTHDVGLMELIWGYKLLSYLIEGFTDVP